MTAGSRSASTTAPEEYARSDAANSEDRDPAQQHGVTDAERIHELLDDIQPRTWVFTGDNLDFEVQQARRDWIEHFSDFLRERLGRSHDIVLNSTTAGTRMARLLQDIDWRVLRFEPDVVLVMPSIRECTEHGDRDEFRETLLQIADRLQAEGCTVVLTTPPCPAVSDESSSRTLRTAVSRIRSVASQCGAVFADNYSHWEAAVERDGKTAGLHDNEGQHPSPRGHRELTRRLLKSLDIRTD